MIGSCGRHVLHGALEGSIQKVNWKVGKLLRAINWLFHDSLAQRDAYLKQGDTKMFPVQVF